MLILKKLISVFLSICICLCLFTPVCFADDSVYDHTHNWVKEKIHSYSLEYNGVAFGIDVFKCSECALYLHTLKFLGYEVPVIRASPDTALGSEAAAMCAQAMVAIFGKEWYATKFEAGGGSASPGGVGRNPSGYAGEGVPNYNSSGAITIMVEPYALGASSDRNFSKNPSNFTVYHLGSSGSGSKYYNDAWCGAIYKFIAPFDGVYYVGSFLPEYNFGYFESFSTGNEWSKISLTLKPSRTREFASTFEKGDECYFIYSNYNHYSAYSGKPYRFKLNSIPIFIDPLDDSGVTKQTNITINNNTFNGNIYVDSSNKLTYIYPQYTVNNETKISNNPIIYNQDTKQYYTYDQTTNNYYYITYGDPVPTPTPSPSPDPGGTTPDPDNPSPSPSPSTAPGGSSDKETGGNSFFNFIFGFGSDTGKDENGKRGIIWSLISLLVSCVTFVVGMGTAYSYLFPFLPPGLCTTIHICVLVLFLFAVIKFIRSFI